MNGSIPFVSIFISSSIIVVFVLLYNVCYGSWQIMAEEPVDFLLFRSLFYAVALFRSMLAVNAFVYIIWSGDIGSVPASIFSIESIDDGMTPWAAKSTSTELLSLLPVTK